MGWFDYDLGINPKKSRLIGNIVIKPISKRVTTKHTERFHMLKHRIPNIIKSTIGVKEIVYGEHALKVRFPGWLERPTQDYDVYSPNPKKDAIQAERELDSVFGGDFFFVKPAQHKGTWKVMAHANQEGYADFTKPSEKVPFDIINGIKYARLSLEKKHRVKSLKDKDFSFRHPKDKDALNRIKIYENMR